MIAFKIRYSMKGEETVHEDICYFNPDGIMAVVPKHGNENQCVIFGSFGSHLVLDKAEDVKKLIDEKSQRAVGELMLERLEKYYQDGQPK